MVSLRLLHYTRLERLARDKHIRDESDTILIKSFNPIDWLHTLNLSFNYLQIITLDCKAPKPPSLIKLITFAINFCFNLVLMFICFIKYFSVVNLIYSGQQLFSYKHYCLLGPFVSNEENVTDNINYWIGINKTF